MSATPVALTKNSEVMVLKVRILKQVAIVHNGRVLETKPGDIVDIPDAAVRPLLPGGFVEPADEIVEPDINGLLGGTNGSRISGVEIRKAREVYGKGAFTPERDVVVVRAENGARLTMSLPLGVEYRDGQWVISDKEKAKKFLKNPASVFGAFLRKYERWPRVGMDVETNLNGKGIARICVGEVEKPPAKAKRAKKEKGMGRPRSGGQNGKGI